MNISEYMETLNEYNISRKAKQAELEKFKKKRQAAFDTLNDLEEVLVIFQTAAEATQNRVAEGISKIVTKAIKAVFIEDNFSFKVKFEKRRNTMECDLFIVEDGKDMKALEDCGYGVADIASLALRVAVWKLAGKARNTFLLDEPTRNLDVDKQPLAGEMLKRLSRMGKGIQFIIVTHQKALAQQGDRLFNTEKGKTGSTIRRVK